MKPFGWFMPATLIALGRHCAHAQQPFTVVELQKMVPELVERRDARRACKILEQRKLASVSSSRLHAWELTPIGADICRAALQATLAVGKAKPALIHPNKATVPTLRDQLCPRLWNLLRIRNALTTVDAVSVLANAGDKTTSLQVTIGSLLRAWMQARPDAIQVSKKRCNGCLRYVLVRDIGSQPPELPKAKKGIA